MYDPFMWICIFFFALLLFVVLIGNIELMRNEYKHKDPFKYYMDKYK